MEGPETRILADHLHDRLAGRRVDRIDVPEHRWQANVLLMNCTGQVIQQVRSHGRWVFLDFAHGTSWACCLVGKSAWRIDRVDAARQPLLTLVLHNGGTATLLGRPVFLTLPTARLQEHGDLRGLGPDPLREGFSLEDLLVRLRKAAARTLAAALLDDEVVAGVGNHLKCEILFAARVWPGTRVAALYASELERVAATAAEVVRDRHRQLVAGGAAEDAVYDRAGEACRVCQGPIVADRGGGDGHWTWYCPKCQPAPAKRTLFDGGVKGE